ncbi:protein FAM117A-like isoform X1 [Denticeps clupeoides]|uniref:Protein FAM117A n=1 Tax=Denticeps clupeoides TaxID=299321 RepID=A0AAY4BDJ1_9TELE|nr:protein FAM117A-like isoform X1 [Denticeps clupeoides]
MSTPSSWSEDSRGRRGAGGHKRSASWGSTDHLREVAKLRHSLQKRFRAAPPTGGCSRPHHPPPAGSAPESPQALSRLAPRMRRSVEGLNLELQGVFQMHNQILDIPDGHRAPVPLQRCSSGSQSDPSPSHSPCPMGEADAVTPCPSPPPCVVDPALLQPACSPRPNKTCAFPREPAEGCEGVGAWQDAASLDPAEPLLLPSSPDPNKVNFTPHGGSAFCPVSLLKPLLPSMDLLFRGLSVSQSAGTGPAVGGFLPGPLSDPATSTT